MSKLENNLKEWVSLHLISPEQAERILNHENARPERSWIVYSLLLLGVIIVGTGIISVVAANWYDIPYSLMLAVDFAMLVGAGILIVQTDGKNNPLKFEMLLLLFLMLCLASIGLIGQIFQTGSEFYEALLLWSLITFPVVLAARYFFIPCLWVGALLTGSSLKMIQLISVYKYNESTIIMAVPLFCVAAIFVIRTFNGRDIFIRAFRLWTVLSGLAAILYAELSWITWSTDRGHTAQLPVYILAAFVAFVVVTDQDYPLRQRSILLLTLGLFLISFNIHLTGIRAEIIHATLTLLELGLISLFWASLKMRPLFGLFVFLIGLRFLVLYFQALGGLAATGAGLIVSGGLIIAMTVLWAKYRKKMAVRAERWMQ